MRNYEMRNVKQRHTKPKHIRLFKGGTWIVIIIESFEHRKIETFTVNCEQRAMNNEH